MFEINLKNIKKGKKYPCIFLLFGILGLLLILNIFISNKVKLNNLDETILSYKVEIETHNSNKGKTLYSPIYYYKVNGKNYSCKSKFSSSDNPGKENKIVYYESKNPKNCVTEYSKIGNYIILICSIVPLIFIIFSTINIRKINKKIQRIKDLNQRGKLVKNIPYRLENTGLIVNGVKIKRIVIDYTTSLGETITLYGDNRYDQKYRDSDGYVDLLIDEKNLTNYYIDFEINRLSGNLPQDYHQLPQKDENNNYQ